MLHPTAIQTGAQGLERIQKLIDGAKFCMLTSRSGPGELRSRPMTLQQITFDGDLWFFTSKASALAEDVVHESSVNVSFSRPDRPEFVSISGHGRFVDDPVKLRELWNPSYQAWLPGGVEDPDLALLQVEITHAEHWDENAGMIHSIRGVAEAVADR